MTHHFPYKYFIIIHRSLIMKTLPMDIALGIVGCIFLCVPQNVLALSLDNLIFFVLLIISSILYQIYVFRTNCGNAAFYLSLPINKKNYLPFYIMISTMPFVIASLLSAVVKILLLLLNHKYTPAGLSFWEREYYLLMILLILKILPLSLYILFKKHPVLIVVFLISIAFTYILIALAVEILSGFVSIPSQMTIFFLFCCILIASVKVSFKNDFH
jgi:hypothetical protein